MMVENGANVSSGGYTTRPNTAMKRDKNVYCDRAARNGTAGNDAYAHRRPAMHASHASVVVAGSITPPARTDDGCARDGRASHTHPPRIAPLISASCTRPVARSVPTGDAATIKDIAAVKCATRDT